MRTRQASRWAAGFALATVSVAWLACGAAPVSAQGRKHALLVGVGDYLHVDDLGGPPNNVHELERVLRRDWGFERDDVTTLLDGAATRSAILGAIDDLTRATQAGDYVFIFFSGHGTSFADQRSALAVSSLDRGTGGLLPADFDPVSSDAFDQLIVGRRDLRPRLERLEQGRDVFVVFDACFSGYTARTLRTSLGGTGQMFQPWISSRPAPSFGDQTFGFGQDDGRYPYDNLLYLSASKEDEFAHDDADPYTALGGALLDGLAGAADTNNDAVLTVRELSRYARRQVEDRYPQTPQLQGPPSRPDLPDRPVFGGGGRWGSHASSAPGSRAATLRVALGDGAGSLGGRLGGLDGVSLSRASFDLFVEADDGGRTFTVRHGSGDTLRSRLSAGEVVRRVARQISVHRLLTEPIAGQDFNVHVEVLERNERGELAPPIEAALSVGRYYEMRYGSEVDAYLLLLNADVQGAVRILVPWTDADLRPAREGRIPDLAVFPPTGTEFVKLFAFRRRPVGLEDWLPASGRREVRVIETESELDALLRFVRAASDDAAETSRKFVTQGGADERRVARGGGRRRAGAGGAGRIGGRPRVAGRDRHLRPTGPVRNPSWQ